MAKLSDNDIAQLAADTKVLLADPTGAPSPVVLEQDRKNLEQEPLFDIYSSEPIINSPNQIIEPDVLGKFEKLTAELVRSNNIEEAFNLSILLEYLLYKENLSLRQQNPNLYAKYEQLLNLCRFVSIISLNLNEIENLLKNYTLLALKKGINVQNKLYVVLRHYDDIMFEGAIAERLSLALSNNSERLGENMIIQEKPHKELPPKVSNWLNDYLMSSHVPVGQQRSSYQKIAYIQNSPNALKLSKQDRDYLYELIKIFDWLAFGDTEVSDNEDLEFLEDSDLGETNLASPTSPVVQKFKMPQEVLEEPPAIARLQPPTVPAPPGGEVKKVGMEEILQNQNANIKNQNGGQAPSLQPSLQTNIASILPNYNKPIPPAKVTAETLAAQMQAGGKSQEPGMGKGIAASPAKAPAPRNEIETEKQPSKAEEFVQKQIDQKLQSLEEKVKGKK